MENMMALKNAYAEIIFNITKEAAARVMLSEQKALAFQKDLDFTKQEALRMLLRLKQMSDATTSEAHITSLNQSRRIEELEAKLNETEGKILDLRAKIGQAYDPLDAVKNNNVHLSNFDVKDDVICCEIAANEIQQIISPLTSSQFNKRHNLTVPTPKDIAQLEKSFNYERNLSSVILESKEPELYRNGCTHRIRAFEKNLLDEKQLCGNFGDELMPVKSDTLANEHNHNVETCALFSPSNDLGGMRNLVRLVELPDHSATVYNQPVKSCILQQEESQNGKAEATLHSLHGIKDLKIQQQCSDIPHQKNNSIMGNEYENYGLNLPQNKPDKMKLVEVFPKLDKKIDCDNNQAVFVPRRSIRKRKARYQDDDIDPSSVPPFLSRCKMNFINHDSTSDLDCLESEANAENNEEKDIVLASRHVTAEVKINDPVFGQNAEGKDDDFIEETEVVKHSGYATKSIRSGKELSTVSDTLGAKTEEASNGAASHADRSSVLQKFSRKHKKEAATKLVERSSPKKQTSAEDKVDMKKSSKESRRLSLSCSTAYIVVGKSWQ
ncbi:hypothetical protein DCAR_0312643 [Daucus carota subsp. sativus]|uniref:Uncharacterized protein n=2 Tax=Daucus carota subsp. sativus TaxID=79200 RepID=A0AAF1AV49_DAUCS|nr:hypothetical protein DCAR_0312643 [Daucus carota subsp. sativus]